MSTTPNRHYELTGETKTHDGVTLYRIRATRDLPAFDVRAGDLGGWIEDLSNLSGNAWVHGNARVSGVARISGNARISGDAQVSGEAEVAGEALVYGNARVYDDALVEGNAQVCGEAQVYGDAIVYGNALVSGDAQISGDALVSGNARVAGDAQVECPEHILVVGPIGSEGVTATLHRSKNDDGHELHVGCWLNGRLGKLKAEVERRRREYWDGSDVRQDAWQAQYDALEALGRATMSQWIESEE